MMLKTRTIIIGLTGLCVLCVIGSIWAMPRETSAPPVATSVSRAALIAKGLSSISIFDCTTASATTSAAVAAPSTPFFQVGEQVPIVPPSSSTPLYQGIWSPQGDAIAFTSPTSEVHFLPTEGSSPGQPYAVSQNELWAYYLANKTWTLVSADALAPRFSTSGMDLLFLTDGRHLMDFSLRSGKATPTGESLPNTSVGILTGSPLANGTLFSPTASSTTTNVWPKIDLTSLDTVLLAPDGHSAFISFASPQAISAFVAQDGNQRPVLRNCSQTAHYAAWLQNGSAIAFMLRGAQNTDIYLTSATTGTTRRVVSFGGRPLINGLSSSPDGQYLVISVGDGRVATPKLWIVSIDGSRSQVLFDGIAPRWSPTGAALLFAGAGPAQPFQWYLAPVRPIR